MDAKSRGKVAESLGSKLATRITETAGEASELRAALEEATREAEEERRRSCASDESLDGTLKEPSQTPTFGLLNIGTYILLKICPWTSVSNVNVRTSAAP